MLCRRVILIGLDSATFDVIFRYIDELPNLKYIIKRGSATQLLSTLPYVSAPAWTSAFTGVNPGKHGIFDFIDFRTELPVTSRSRRVPALWNIISRAGKKVVIVNVPVTYPPERVNGVMISGCLTPSKQSEFVYPPILKKCILKKRYEIDIPTMSYYLLKKNALVRLAKDIEATRVNVFKHLIEYVNPHFSAVVLMSLDRVQHYCMDDERLLREFYVVIDSLIGSIMTEFDDGKTTFIVMSDHGMHLLEKDFFINNFLIREGYALPIRVSKSTPDILMEYVSLISMSFLKKLPYNLLYSLISVENYLKQVIKCLKVQPSITIDKMRSVAYSPIGYEIKVKKPRFINAILNSLRNINQKLKSNIIRRVYTREELYWGLATKYAPEIIVEPHNGVEFSRIVTHDLRLLGRSYFGSMLRVAEHTRWGILITYSAKTKGQGYRQTHVNRIYDVAKIVLHLLKIRYPIIP